MGCAENLSMRHMLAILLLICTAAAANTSIIGAKFHPHDFNFSTTSYVLANTFYFNTSAPNTEFAFMHTQNLQKLSGAGTNNATRRVSVDGVVMNEELAGSLSGTAVLSVGTSPFLFNVSPGSHNITIEWERTGAGTIEVKNIDSNVLQFKSAQGNDVRGEILNGTYAYSSASFIPAFNWTVSKAVNSSTFMVVKQLLNASGAATADHYIFDFADNSTSPYWKRALSGSTDFSSASGSFIEENANATHNYTLESRVSAGSLTANFTIIDMDLRDNASNLVNHFQLHNNLTNLTNNITYAAGIRNLVNVTVKAYNGTSYFLAAFVSIGTTSAAQTPVFFINSSGLPTASCFSKKERSLSGNTDIAVVYMYTTCENLTVGNNYTFNLWANVSATETLVVYDEGMSGFEETPFNVTAGLLPPLPNTINSPSENSTVSGALNITWDAFSDPNGDNVTYNISLYNSSRSFNRTINASTNATSQMFNTSAVPDGSWYVYVFACDPGGLCSNNSANFSIDNTPPSITWLNQTPADLDILTLFSKKLNITYGISDPSGISSASAYLMTNSTNSSVFYYLNGTAVSGFINAEHLSNNSANWTILASADDVYPGTYNINESVMSGLPHLNFTLNNNNEFLKVRFFNVSSSLPYGVLGVMATNISNVSLPLRIRYCNSSYTTGSPITSTNCYNFYNIDINATANVTEGNSSAYFSVPFAINTTSGNIGTVKVTSTSYITLDSRTGQGWNVGYIANVTRADTVQNTSNSGGAWRNYSATVDMHLHQYDGYSLYYYICANDTLNNSNCSTIRQDLISAAGLPPLAPEVYSFERILYRGMWPVNYTAAQSPNQYPIVYYNITLLDANGTYLQTIAANNSLNLSYMWNSSSTPDAPLYSYLIRVWACDNMSQCSFGDSLRFGVDNTPPALSMASPVNSSFQNSSIIQINISVFEINLNYTDISIYNSTGSLVNSTLNASNGTYSVSLGVPRDGTYNITATAYDLAGNSNTTTSSITVDTTIPSISINSPSSNSFLNNRTISINITASGTNFNTTNITIYNSTGMVNSTLNTSTGNYVVQLTVPAEGAYNITATAYNLLGASSTSSKSNITVDTITPLLSLLSPLNITYNVTSVSLNFTASDANPLTCVYSLDGAANATLAGCANATLSALAQGNHSVFLYANESAGNLNSSSVYFSVDSIAPVISINSPADNAILNSRAVQINISITEANLNYTNISIINSTGSLVNSTLNSSNGTYSITLTVPADGLYNITTTAYDNGGNSKSRISQNIRVDTVVPSLVVQSPANMTYNTSDINVNFTASDSNGIATCTYQLDADAPVSGCSNDTLSSLSEGGHTITVNASDNAGNTNSTAVHFAVDTTGPSVSIQTPANATYNTTSIALNFTASDASGISSCNYQLDANAPVSGCSNATLSSLAEGNHGVRVNATDSAGNRNSTILYFSVDLTAPSLSLQSPANITYNTTSITLNFTVSGPGVDKCWYSLNGGPDVMLASCANATFNATAGANSIAVYANDSAGNTNSTTQYFSALYNTTIDMRVFNIDYSDYPETANTTFIGLALNDTSHIHFYPYINYTYAANGTAVSGAAVALTCSNLVGIHNSYYGFTPPSIFDYTADTSTIELEGDSYIAVNFTGTYNQTPAAYLGVVLQVCKNSPTAATGEVRLGATLNWSNGSAGDTIDPASIALCPAITGLHIDGITAFKDSPDFYLMIGCPNCTAGNGYAIWKTNDSGMMFQPNRSFETSSGDSGWAQLNGSDQNYNYPLTVHRYFALFGNFSLAYNSTYGIYLDDSRMYTLEGGETANCTLSASKSDHVSRTRTELLVNAVEPLQMNIDALEDAIQLHANPVNGTTLEYGNITLYWSAFHPQGISYSYSNLTYANGTQIEYNDTSTTVHWGKGLFTAPGGVYNLTVWANSTDGNFSSQSIWFYVNDTTVPSLSIQSPANSTYAASVIGLNFTANDSDGLSCTYQLDSNAPVSGCANASLSNLSQGSHNARVNATDNAGNRNSTIVYFSVDTITPLLSFLSPLNITYNVTSVSLNFTVSDANPLICAYSLDGAANATLAGCANATLSALAQGGHSVILYANDSAGNLNSSSVYFSVDSIAPVISINSPADNAILNSRAVQINISITEINLNYTNISIINSTGSLVNSTLNSSNGTYSITLTVPADGLYNITTTTYDKGGNSKSRISQNILIDSVAPSLAIQSPTNSTYYVSTVDVNFTASDSNGIASCSQQLDGDAPVSGCSNDTLSSLGNGGHSVRVNVTDSAGNRNSTVVYFNVDTAAPLITINAPASDSTTANLIVGISVTIIEPNINFTNVSIYNSTDMVNSTTSAANGTFVVHLLVPGDGKYNITATAYDLGGRSNSTTNSNITVRQSTGGSSGGCTYDWLCSDWFPSTCPQSGVQTRQCMNSGTCTGTEGQPDETRACFYQQPLQNQTNLTNVTPPYQPPVQNITNVTPPIQPPSNITPPGGNITPPYHPPGQNFTNVTPPTNITPPVNGTPPLNATNGTGFQGGSEGGAAQTLKVIAEAVAKNFWYLAVIFVIVAGAVIFFLKRGKGDGRYRFRK